MMDHNSAIKRNDLLRHAIWVNLKYITLSEKLYTRVNTVQFHL